MSEEREKRQQEELNQRGKPAREKAAGICWHHNVENWISPAEWRTGGMASNTHQVGTGTKSPQRVGCSKATIPVTWKAGEKPSSSKGHRGLTVNDSQLHVVKKPVFLRIWGYRPVFMQVCVSDLWYLHDQWNLSLRSQLGVGLGCLQLQHTTNRNTNAP